MYGIFFFIPHLRLFIHFRMSNCDEIVTIIRKKTNGGTLHERKRFQFSAK